MIRLFTSNYSNQCLTSKWNIQLCFKSSYTLPETNSSLYTSKTLWGSKNNKFPFWGFRPTTGRYYVIMLVFGAFLVHPTQPNWHHQRTQPPRALQLAHHPITEPNIVSHVDGPQIRPSNPNWKVGEESWIQGFGTKILQNLKSENHIIKIYENQNCFQIHVSTCWIKTWQHRFGKRAGWIMDNWNYQQKLKENERHTCFRLF